MNPRILVLSASYGEGHNAAARAVVEAVREAAGPDSADLVDVFALAKPRMNEFARRAYIAAINRTPRLWSRLYAWMDRSRLLAWGLDGFLLERERAQLVRILQESRATCLCSTYPAYAFMIRRLRREGYACAPHYTVVTDSISINSLWHRAGSEGWFVPNEESAESMRRAGVPGARIEVTGFPVNLRFARNRQELSPPDLAGPASSPRVLYIINSGTIGAEATARRLLAESAWEITCAVGRDDALRQRLERAAAGRARPARILGWTDRIPELLMTHHALVSKAGGATTQEAIAARCPMIVNQIVPGQEEGNYELLRRHDIGGYARTPDAIAGLLQAAFADGGRTWRDWRRRLEDLSRPEAARAIARSLLAAHPAGRPLESLRIP